MSILILIISILLMLVLISAGKLNSFLSLIIASLYVDIVKEMQFLDIINSQQEGISSTFGSLILISFGSYTRKYSLE
jgi:Gnt-I system high-affinity gluconate transporter/Gnt-II system L-idonate transporter